MTVNHPEHYGGDTTYETIKVIEAWDLGFNLGNAVKYISRAGKKPGTDYLEDLDKAVWYIKREIYNTIKEQEHLRVIEQGSFVPAVGGEVGKWRNANRELFAGGD